MRASRGACRIGVVKAGAHRCATWVFVRRGEDLDAAWGHRQWEMDHQRTGRGETAFEVSPEAQRDLVERNRGLDRIVGDSSVR